MVIKQLTDIFVRNKKNKDAEKTVHNILFYIHQHGHAGGTGYSSPPSQ